MNKDTSPDNDAAKDFYDRFYEKLIADFVFGNPRIESALQFACSQLILAQSSKILDLGFGLGWSTFEFSRARLDAEIRGLDLSSKLTELAHGIFGSEPRISFECQDLTDKEWISEQPENYDACVMLDVYEHIPAEHREGFHAALGRILGSDAILVMSCPTPAHQNYLRQENPQGLQPVDEDVTFDDLVSLAKALGAEITHLQYVSIWMKNDYFQVTISRGSPATGPKLPKSRHTLIDPRERRKMVKYADNFVGTSVVKRVLSRKAVKTSSPVGRIKRALRTFLNP